MDTQIIKYRALVERTSGGPPDSVLRLHPDFRDAVAGGPVPAAEFLHSLKLGRVEELLPSPLPQAAEIPGSRHAEVSHADGSEADEHPSLHAGIAPHAEMRSIRA